MSRTFSSYLVGIGPSGSSQLTVPLSTPTNTFPTSTPSLSITSTSSSSTSTPMSTPTASSSPAPRVLPVGAIIGGTLGGLVALIWLVGLLYFAHLHNWFRRPGYSRTREESGRSFEKRDHRQHPHLIDEGPFADRPNVSEPTYNPALTGPSFGRVPPPPAPIPVPTPRPMFSEPRADPPAESFYQHQPPGYVNRFRDQTQERPRSAFDDRPRSAFGGTDKRRSASQDRTRRTFFGGNGGPQRLHSDAEWEGAGARRESAHNSPGMEESQAGGWFGWLTRARSNAERRKRVKAEYEEDMRRMRGRSTIESDYTRY